MRQRVMTVSYTHLDVYKRQGHPELRLLTGTSGDDDAEGFRIHEPWHQGIRVEVGDLLGRFAAERPGGIVLVGLHGCLLYTSG